MRYLFINIYVYNDSSTDRRLCWSFIILLLDKEVMNTEGKSIIGESRRSNRFLKLKERKRMKTYRSRVCGKITIEYDGLNRRYKEVNTIFDSKDNS